MRSVLSIRGFGARFQRVILSDVDLDLPEQGILNLMGPCGAGKSTLLRSLAGLNDNNKSFQRWGAAVYMGEPLGEVGWPEIVEQKSTLLAAPLVLYMTEGLPEPESLTPSQKRHLIRTYLEQMDVEYLVDQLDDCVSHLQLVERRIVSILTTSLSQSPVVFIDEPTAGLPVDGAASVLDVISRVAERHSVIVVLHNQKHAQKLDGRTALLAGGRIQELADTKTFFSNPVSVAARDFVRSGTCAVPSADADPTELDEEIVNRYRSDHRPEKTPINVIPFGPRGFKWIQKRILGSCPRPGLMGDFERDLAALEKVGVDHLVSLEETETVKDYEAEPYGISVNWYPIEDMGVPPRAAARELVHWMESAIDQGGKVAVHCKAGLGRTGTILAAYLIHKGMNAADAIEAIRSVEPRMIQSSLQEGFLHSFEEWNSPRNRIPDHPDQDANRKAQSLERPYIN